MSNKCDCVLYDSEKNMCRGLLDLYCEPKSKRGIPQPASECRFFKDKEEYHFALDGYIQKNPDTIWKSKKGANC